ncbi:MAG: transglycosylase domain-containing protein [Bacteroidia bacterium]|nr:transglycosylase domain-containing protein [Bacteroidia bacterium]
MKSKSWMYIVLISAVMLVITILLLRQPLLEFAIHKASQKFREKFAVELSVGESGFKGFRDIYFRDLLLVPANGDTLLSIKNFNAKISISKLVRLQLGFRELTVDTTLLSLIHRDSSDNFSFLMKRNKPAESDTAHKEPAGGFDERFMAVLDRVNDLFNERITIRQFKVSYQRGSVQEMVNIPELYFDGAVFQSSVVTSSKEGVNLWIVNGKADAGNSSYDFHVQRTRGAHFALPFIDLFDGFKVCFDSAHVQLSAKEQHGQVSLKGHFDIHNLLVSHWRISPQDVRFPSMEFRMNGYAAADSLGLMKGTVFTMNQLPVSITASYSRKPERRMKLSTEFSTSKAQDLFDAMPGGMFYTFRGFRASGQLHYHLETDIPLGRPEQLVFSSELEKKNFRIESYGTENFAKIALPFSFLAMDGDRPVRSFTVGPENPYFTPLNFISPYLQAAVLTAEDPSFMNHGGFVEESFRESIATNIRQGRFARGGSTISMQLVKNVFLSRNKSVSRKLEEILIVWLIEQNRLLSKERMFEVYLNIIEWGPNVYGIGEAARFYFNKSADELDLAESIFLASLIPSPKHFRYRFDQSGQLKPYVAGFFKVVSGRLVKREKITQAEADSLKPFVKLNGPALDFILPQDSIAPDSMDLVPIVPKIP